MRHRNKGNFNKGKAGDSPMWQGKTVFFAIVLFGLAAFFVPEKSRETLWLPFKQEVHVPTANPKASEEARDVLRLLYDIKGSHTLSGQHNYLEAPAKHTRDVRSMTGHTPAVIGFELGAILNHSDADVHRYRERVVEEAIRANRSGSLVTITYHAAMPGACGCWEEVRNGGISEELFREIITEGTDMHEAWLADIDEVARYLKQLRDARVPVLWRPYHEMNGRWFWWGGQPAFAELWDLMFDRYTDHHELDNLLWVWSPSAPNDYAKPFEPFYVGHLRADVLAVDVYFNEYEQSHHDQLLRLGGGKPIALGEVGELPDADLLAGEQNQYVWFMAWGDELEQNNSWRKIDALYSLDRVLHRRDLSSLR